MNEHGRESADLSARELKDVVASYLLSVPLAAVNDDGSRKHQALRALDELVARADCIGASSDARGLA